MAGPVAGVTGDAAFDLGGSLVRPQRQVHASRMQGPACQRSHVPVCRFTQSPWSLEEGAAPLIEEYVPSLARHPRWGLRGPWTRGGGRAHLGPQGRAVPTRGRTRRGRREPCGRLLSRVQGTGSVRGPAVGTEGSRPIQEARGAGLS